MLNKRKRKLNNDDDALLLISIIFFLVYNFVCSFVSVYKENNDTTDHDYIERLNRFYLTQP